MAQEKNSRFTKADGYERYLGPWSSALASRFIDFAGVRDGDRVLDVGSGTGSLALTLAASMPRVEVIGIDPSAPYVEFARKRTSDPRVRFDVGDAMKLPYANDYFDKSLAQLVLWSVPDAKRAVVEMFRVTRARGILAACVWGSGEHNERSHLFWEAAIAVDAAAKAQRETPGGYDREGGLYALWADCSLKEVKEVSLPVSVDFASFDEFWLPHLEGQGRVGSYVESLPRDHQEALRKRLRDDLLALKGDGPFSLRAEAVAVRGIR